MNPADVLKASFNAECACHRADVLDSLMRETDVLVAKGLAISEVAQIARIERRDREMLIVKWSARAEQAATTAGAVITGGGALSDAFKATDVVMKKWEGDVKAPHTRNLEDAYRLARHAGVKKASGNSKASLQYGVMSSEAAVKKAGKSKATFDVADEGAIAALSRQEMMWIGETYANVAPTVRAAVEPKLLKGLSKAEAGKLVRDAVEKSLKDFSIPGGFHGSYKSYFDGLAANAITNARVQGQIGSFARLGVTHYTIVNPMDDRTSLICQHMNGQTFEVRDAVKFLEDLGDAETPEEYKAIHPWLSEAKVSSLVDQGTSALVRAGMPLPPFHFRCRSTVDIALD